MVEGVLLKANSLDVYRGKRLVLQSTDLSLKEAEAVALVGPNGCGKTTLLESCAGMHSLSAGNVLWFEEGNEIVIADFEGRRNYLPIMGLTLQKDGICGEERVIERVRTSLAVNGFKPSEEHLSDLLGAWGLEHRRDESVSQLSGGLRRRLAVLAGLAPLVMSNEPRVALLDEPSVGLDESARGILINWMRALIERGHSILVATHDPEIIAACDRIHLFNEDGTISESTQIVSAKSSSIPETCESGLSSPVMEMFAWALRMEKRNPIDTISRAIPAILALLLAHTFISNDELAIAGNDLLSALIIAPAFISALVAPALIKRYAEADCGRWWSAMLGPMHRPASSLIGASLILPIPLTYIALLVFGDILPAESYSEVVKWLWLPALSLIDVAIAAAALHLLVADLRRSSAAAASLLLLVLIWPFLELTDALSMIIEEGMSFSLGLEEPLVMILLASLTCLLVWVVAVFLPEV